MNPTQLWMRHGTCEDGLHRPGAHARLDSPLTVGGAAEAVATARRLQKYEWPVALVLYSPLRRVRQTAALVASTLGARLGESAPPFAEWRAPDSVLGLTAAEYPPAYRNWRKQRAHDPDSALPGGESLRDFAERAVYAATLTCELAAAHGPVLVVSHRLLIGAVAAVDHGHQQPTDLFDYAVDFGLAPAQVWTRRQEAPW